MKLKDIMHRPTFVSPDSKVCEAARIMAEKNISSVIVGDEYSPIGMFTERDMLREVVVKNLDSKNTSMVDLMCSGELKKVMCKIIMTLPEDTPLEEAVDKMMGRYIRHMPVTDKSGKIVGMVSARTIMNALKAKSFKKLSI